LILDLGHSLLEPGSWMMALGVWVFELESETSKIQERRSNIGLRS
jgi:hypothetical protein